MLKERPNAPAANGMNSFMKSSGTKRGDQLNEVDEASEEGSQPDKGDGSDELETDSDEDIDSHTELDSLNADELAEE